MQAAIAQAGDTTAAAGNAAAAPAASAPEVVDSSPVAKQQRMVNTMAEEKPVADFSCTYSSGTPGRLYVYGNRLAFHALFFSSASLVVPLRDITAVHKRNSALVFPNAIEIDVGPVKHFFGTFLYRDLAYARILETWKEGRPQDLDEELLLPSDGESSDSGEEDTTDSDSLVEEEPLVLADVVFPAKLRSSTTRATQQQQFQPRDLKLPFASCCRHLTLAAWGDTQPRVEHEFSMSISDFYLRVFSDAFWRRINQLAGYTEISVSPWAMREHECCHCRTLNYVVPVRHRYTKKRSASIHQEQRAALSADGLLLEATTSLTDLGFAADAFFVKTLYRVMPLGDSCCRLSIYTKVQFLRPMLKYRAILKHTTMQSTQEYYNLLLNTAHVYMSEVSSPPPIVVLGLGPAAATADSSVGSSPRKRATAPVSEPTTEEEQEDEVQEQHPALWQAARLRRCLCCCLVLFLVLVLFLYCKVNANAGRVAELSRAVDRSAATMAAVASAAQAVRDGDNAWASSYVEWAQWLQALQGAQGTLNHYREELSLAHAGFESRASFLGLPSHPLPKATTTATAAAGMDGDVGRFFGVAVFFLVAPLVAAVVSRYLVTRQRRPSDSV
eukprot:TRINITY_DN3885_c0_g1_i1.p1 TRINITY_DN3885_c0_g1~~TRINITY_DN3885_c0_g1_i1.p1  ORF type:complete len:676 (-),score=160.84 TRINITY_DN3885_c0_g1_i1:37-1875(-)